jgi:methionyl aminopeptidase
VTSPRTQRDRQQPLSGQSGTAANDTQQGGPAGSPGRPRRPAHDKWRIPRRSEAQIEAIGKACRIVALALDAVEEAARPGVTTAELNAIARELIEGQGGTSLFRGYTRASAPPFPGDVCLSVNEQIVHGVPSERIIVDGDVVTIDCGVRFQGWCGDAARTLLVGEVTEEARRLARTTRNVLELAIDMMTVGALWSDIARAMQTAAEDAKFGVVVEYVGHGIGKQLHEPPKVPAFATGWDWRRDFVLRPGMVLAIEPMLTAGSPQVASLDDGWTVATRDGSLAAHEEHTIAVRDSGIEVLTRT